MGCGRPQAAGRAIGKALTLFYHNLKSHRFVSQDAKHHHMMACKQPTKHYGDHGCNRGSNSSYDYRYCPNYSPLTTLPQQVYGTADGRVADHQRRIGKKTLDSAIDALRSAGFDKNGRCSQCSFKDFEELHDTIAKIIGGIGGIGDLAIYDIAVRIGAHQDPVVAPKDYVYIHRGTRTGAEKALGRGIKGRRIPLTDFQGIPYLDGMNALEIEDFLCINKDKLPLKR